MEMRVLEPREIEVRAQQVSGSNDKVGVALLLYKNARCDMAILDETFGILGWQREHSFKDGHNYCKVSVWDVVAKQWVIKEDVGVESNMDGVKGEASDSFKRACFNLGIGRELYTAPFIWVWLDPSEYHKNEKTGKNQLNANVYFVVESIQYNEDREISYLKIVDNKGVERFTYGKPSKTITRYTLQRKNRVRNLIAFLEKAYSKNPEAFQLIDYMRQNGFEFADGVDNKLLEIWIEHISNKGL